MTADVDALAALHAAAFTTPRPWTASEIQSLLSSTGAFAIVDPNGFALGRALAGEAELLTMAVASRARRQGIGRTLLQGFEAQALAHGATEAFLEVASDNPAAITLYQAHGFQDAGTRIDYYQRPDKTRIDARVMRKLLKPLASA